MKIFEKIKETVGSNKTKVAAGALMVVGLGLVSVFALSAADVSVFGELDNTLRIAMLAGGIGSFVVGGALLGTSFGLGKKVKETKAYKWVLNRTNFISTPHEVK